MIEAACWDSRLYYGHQVFAGQYSSYPSSKHFNRSISAFERYSAVRSNSRKKRPLALYLYIPKLESQSYSTYLKALFSEINSLARLVPNEYRLEHLYIVGAPCNLEMQQLQQVMHTLKKHFHIEGQNLVNYSININPYRVNWATMGAIRDMGFNRICLKTHIEPFNFQQLQTIYEAARTLHFCSISIDMLYGLPKQDFARLSQQLTQVLTLMPERIRLTRSQQSPCHNLALQLVEHAVEALMQAGYQYIGMDCFALPDDDLVSAQEAGLLSYNLQGCTTGDNYDILGFGLAAVSQIGSLYYQNTANLDDYINNLNKQQLPPALGLTCSTDDLIRRYIIHALTNRHNLSIYELESKFNIVFAEYFKNLLPYLEQMQADGLVSLSQQQIKIIFPERLLADSVCRLFDRFHSPALTQPNAYTPAD